MRCMGIVHVYRTEAVVLRYSDYSETSKIVTLITPDRGKLAGIVKGAKRPKNRFGSSLEPLTHIEAVFFGKEGSRLATISQTHILEDFDGLRCDFDRLAYGGYMIELCDKFVQEEEESGELFEFLLASLRLLCGWTGNLALLATGFGLRFLRLAGYEPALDGCVGCGKTAGRDKTYFSVDDGGVVCAECRQQGAFEITSYHLRLMRNLSRVPLARMQRAAVRTDVLTETFDLLNAYVSRRGGVRLRSPAFLKATL